MEFQEVRSPISSVKFTSYTKEDIESFSVLPITGSGIFDHSGNPIKEGVYDPRLGATENSQKCEICGQNAWNCNGHFGHIHLSRPVYHPFYIKNLRQLICGMCPHCNMLRIPEQIVIQVEMALKLVARGFVIEHDFMNFVDDGEQQLKEKIRVMEEVIHSTPVIPPNSYTSSMRSTVIKTFLSKIATYKKICSNCQSGCSELKFDSFHFQFVNNNDASFVPIENIKELLYKFYEKNQSFYNEFFSDIGPSQFFIETVCVTPSKFRPASVLGDKINAHPSSSALADIVKSEISLAKSIADDDKDGINNNHSRLQSSVNAFFDNTLVKSNKKLPHGIRQILEKKEGLFRKNLMGKRVNFSARSVITPDPYISTDEIGVPEIFAKTLSYPEKVTEFNKDKLSKLILNGPDVYPGANFITNGEGRTYRLANMTDQERNKFAKMIYSNDGSMPIIVGRHVQDGDFVLINRQPTLHRVSILGMKARVLPNQKTLRMHYSNCASFNADFDGDEINLHLLQNELGRSEAKHLSLSSIHYVTPTAGNPIRGLIQDHVDSGALLTMKDKFFTYSQYSQLVFSAFGNEPNCRLILLQPAIIYPKQLWTGKQVISTILINLTKDKEPLMLTSKSKFTNQLLRSDPEECNVCFFDSELMYGIMDKAQYGASTYGLVHSLFELYGSQLAGRFLTMLSCLFTYYLQTHGFTCGIDDMVITHRAEHIRNEMNQKMKEAAKEAGQSFVKEYGSPAKSHLPFKQQLLELVMKPDLKERFDNHMKNAINPIATEIISAIFPLQLSKRFPKNCLITMTQSGAKGSVVNLSQMACLLGQQELEGKRVPFMSSGKSLPSFKPMKLAPIAGGFISSRFLTGLKPQEYYFHCMAGREGLTDTAVKTANTGYLQRCIIKHMEGIRVAYDGTVRNSDDNIIQFLYGEDGIDPMNNKYIEKFEFMEDNYNAYLSKLNISELMEKAECEEAMNLLDSKRRTESFEKSLNSYCENENIEHKIDPEKLKAIALFNYFKSQIQPGEIVGIIAAQAIGEPATQMTLNTFHLAGYGGANVTLGIPRLREILVVATHSPITPTMSIPLKIQNDKEEAEKFVSKFKRVSLKEIIKSYKIIEDFNVKNEVKRNRIITIILKFNEEQFNKWNLYEDEKLLTLKRKFSSLLKKKINSILKSTGIKINEVNNDDLTLNANSNQRYEEMGADLSKKNTRKNEQNSYEADDDEIGETNKSKNNKKKKSNDNDEEEPKNDEDKMELDINLEELSMFVRFNISNVNIKILLDSIIENVLNEIKIQEIKGVTKANYTFNKNGQVVINTEGYNFDEIIENDLVDINHFYTNHIYGILEHFGIEAARNAIIKEVQNVFNAYSISIDKRHLQLIADYVTNTGEWLGMSRHSMKCCPSPFQQMSFENNNAILILRIVTWK
ncbi:DNA-directed RNA polymerase I subunit rpa1 [Histomonas meleagridis]|nr:DNA-directed RNA polymerase I subunit rpa1 [Histomonas meleagridis]